MAFLDFVTHFFIFVLPSDFGLILALPFCWTQSVPSFSVISGYLYIMELDKGENGDPANNSFIPDLVCEVTRVVNPNDFWVRFGLGEFLLGLTFYVSYYMILYFCKLHVKKKIVTTMF